MVAALPCPRALQRLTLQMPSPGVRDPACYRAREEHAFSALKLARFSLSQWWLRHAQNLALVTNLTEGRAVLSRVLASLFVLTFLQGLGVTPNTQIGGSEPRVAHWSLDGCPIS